jgi:hypothetical protein
MLQSDIPGQGVPMVSAYALVSLSRLQPGNFEKELLPRGILYLYHVAPNLSLIR